MKEGLTQTGESTLSRPFLAFCCNRLRDAPFHRRQALVLRSLFMLSACNREEGSGDPVNIGMHEPSLLLTYIALSCLTCIAAFSAFTLHQAGY